MGLAEKGGTVGVSLIYGVPVKPIAMNEDQLSLIGLAPPTSQNIVVCPAHPVYASANTSPTSDVSVTSSVSSSLVVVTTQVSQTEAQLSSSVSSAILMATQNPSSTPSSTGTFLSDAAGAEEETESLPSILILSCQGNYTAHDEEEENDQQHDSREETRVHAVAQNSTQTCSVSPKIHSPKPQGISCSQKQPPSISSLGLSEHQQKVLQTSPLISSPLQTPRTPVSSPQPPSDEVSAHNQPAQATFVTLPTASHLPPQSAGTVSPDVGCFQVPRPTERVSHTMSDPLLRTQLQGSIDQRFTGIPCVDQRHSGLPGVEQRHCSLSGVNPRYGSMSSVNQRLDGLPSVDQRLGNIPGLNQRLGGLPFVDQRHGIIPGFIPGLDQRHGGLLSVDQRHGVLPFLDQRFGGMPRVDQMFNTISSAVGTPNSVPSIMTTTSLSFQNLQPMTAFNTAYLPQVSTGYPPFGGYRGAVFRPGLGSGGLLPLRQVGIQNFPSQVQPQNSSTRQPHGSQVQPWCILPVQPPSTISMPSRYSPISPVSDPQPIVPSTQPDPDAAALGTHVQYTSSVTPIQNTQSTHIVSGASTASTVSRLGVSGFSRAHADSVSVTGTHSATDSCLQINIESSTLGLGVMIKKEATESVTNKALPQSVAGSVLTTTSTSNSTAAHSVPKYIRRNEIVWCLQCKKKMDNGDAVYSHIWDHKHPSGERCSSCTHEDVSGRAKCLQTKSEIENILSRADASILSLVSKADLREKLLHNQRLFSFESSDSVVAETTGDAGDGNVPPAREESVSAGTDQCDATSDTTTCGQSGSAESQGAGDARPVVPCSTDSQSEGSTTVIHSGAESSEKHAGSNAAVLTEHSVCTDSSGTNTDESTATSADAHTSCANPNTTEKIVYSNVQDLVSGNFSASDCAPAQATCLSVPSVIEATEKKTEETELVSDTNSNSAVALPTETAESDGAMCASSSQSQGDKPVQQQHAEQALDPQATHLREDSHVPSQHSEETIAVACHSGHRSDSIDQPQDEASRMSTEDQTATEPQSIDLMSMFYVCSLCEYRCCLAIDFTQHLSSEHHDEEFFICHHCSYRGCYATDLTNHIFNHTCGPPEMYLCPECSFRTDNLQALGVHLVTEHSAANSFRCKTCKTTFSAQDSLMAHLQENSLTLFSCSKCPARFLSKRAIKQHFQKEHSGTRAHRVIKMLLCYDRKWNNYQPPAVASLSPSSFPIASKVPSLSGVSTGPSELPVARALTTDVDELCAHDPTARFVVLEIPEEQPVGIAGAPAEWEHSLLSATPESDERTRNGESARLSPSLPISLAASLGLMAQPAGTAPAGTAPVTADHACDTLKAMCTEKISLLPATTQEAVQMSGLENDDASALIPNNCSSGSRDGVGDGANDEASDKLVDLFGSDELHEAMRDWLYQEKGGSSYTCIICDKPYPTLRNIQAHLFKHSHVPVTCCVYCHRAATSVAALKHHFNQKHSGEPLSVIYLKVNKASLLDKLINHRSSEDPVGYFETICDGIRKLFDKGIRMAEESEGGGEKDAHPDSPASHTALLHPTGMESQPDCERLSDGTECVPEDAKSLDGEETIGGNLPIGDPENQQDNQPSDTTKHSGDGSRSFSASSDDTQEQGQSSLSCTAEDGLKTQTERNKNTYTLDNKQKAVASSSIHVHSNVSKKNGPPSSLMSNFSTFVTKRVICGGVLKFKCKACGSMTLKRSSMMKHLEGCSRRQASQDVSQHTKAAQNLVRQQSTGRNKGPSHPPLSHSICEDFEKQATSGAECENHESPGVNPLVHMATSTANRTVGSMNSRDNCKNETSKPSSSVMECEELARPERAEGSSPAHMEDSASDSEPVVNKKRKRNGVVMDSSSCEEENTSTAEVLVKLKCKSCAFSLPRTEETLLKKHVQEHPNFTKLSMCGHCSFLYNRENQLKNHNKLNHSEEPQKSLPVPWTMFFYEVTETASSSSQSLSSQQATGGFSPSEDKENNADSDEHGAELGDNTKEGKKPDEVSAQHLPTGQKVSNQPLPTRQKVTDQSLSSRQKVLDKTSLTKKMKRMHQDSVDNDSTSSSDGTGGRRVRKRVIRRNRSTAIKAKQDIHRQLADDSGDESSFDDTDNDKDFDIEEYSSTLKVNSLSVSSIGKGRRNFPGKQNSETGPSTPKKRPDAPGKQKLKGLACVDKDIASGNQNSEGVPFKEFPSAKEDRQDAPRKQNKDVSSSDKDGQCASATVACPTSAPTKNNAPSDHEGDQEPLSYRYICTQCEEKATDKRSMCQHISRHLEYKVVKCKHCEVTFYSHKDVVQHSAEEHPTLLVEKQIKKDPRKEMQLDRLVFNAQRKAEKEKIRVEVQPLADKLCPISKPVMMTITTPRPGPLAESEIVKNGVQCIRCSHEFDSVSEFKDHSEKKHTSDKVPILHWRDSVSGAVYDLKGNMQEEGRNPYQVAHKYMCAFCGFRCSMKDAAQEHHKAKHEGFQWILMLRTSYLAMAPRVSSLQAVHSNDASSGHSLYKPWTLAESEIVKKGVQCMRCSHEFDSVSEFKDHSEKKHTSDKVPILHWRDSVSGAVYDLKGDVQEASQNPCQFAHKYMCAFCGFRCSMKDAALEHHKAKHEGWQWILMLRTSCLAKAPQVSSRQASPSSNASAEQISSEVTLSSDAGTQNKDVFSVRNTLNITTDSSPLVQAASGTVNSTSGGMCKRTKMLSRAAQNNGGSSSTSTLSNSTPQASQDAVDSPETSSHSTPYTTAEILHSLNRTPTSDVKLSHHSKPTVKLVDFVLLKGSACEEWLNACGVNALDVYGLEKEKLQMFLS